MIPTTPLVATPEEVKQLIESAVDHANSLVAVARRTGLALRRLEYLRAGDRHDLRPAETLVLHALIQGKL